jgi:AcrR family transcriptional regulator
MKKGEQARGATPDTRERILRTASELFYREGTRAVGVDLIVERAGLPRRVCIVTSGRKMI